eukprot:3385210-Rhodomonas_salina.1
MTVYPNLIAPLFDTFTPLQVPSLSPSSSSLAPSSSSFCPLSFLLLSLSFLLSFSFLLLSPSLPPPLSLTPPPSSHSPSPFPLFLLLSHPLAEQTRCYRAGSEAGGGQEGELRSELEKLAAGPYLPTPSLLSSYPTVLPHLWYCARGSEG